MKIEFEISRDSLGDNNTETDNMQYIKAVQSALQKEYPNADIQVEITRSNMSKIWVDDDPYGEVEANVREIAKEIWDMELY